MSSKRKFANRDWHYDYENLPYAFSDIDCRRVTDRLQQRYSALAKQWNPEINSEWTCRLYLAAKLVMSATLHVNSAGYAESRNLRVVLPYLYYYSVFSLVRAICYTLPEHHWNNGGLIQIPHDKAFSGALDHIRKFDTTVTHHIGDQIRQLKAERELISYRAPSVGDGQIAEKKEFLSLCTLLAEVAQFNSELLDVALTRHGNPASFQLPPEFLEKIASPAINGHYFGDIEDAYRLDYLSRKSPRPGHLREMMREGHVDDFFGAWTSHDENPVGQFNPDALQQIVFDIP